MPTLDIAFLVAETEEEEEEGVGLTAEDNLGLKIWEAWALGVVKVNEESAISVWSDCALSDP